MTEIRVVRDYPHPPAKVWRALTDPELIALWSMRPEGYAPVVGTHYKMFGEPNRYWRGYVECEVLEVRPLELLRYSWVGNDEDKPTEVRYELETHGSGTRLTLVHSGFAGVRGFVFANLIMRPGWNKLLSETFPTLLAELDERGALRPQSQLKPRYKP
jgi:uncharacterized protein YndB with AHSA1/START domain